MRRVLVPLDGTDLAAAIVPDARRLAGPDGELILIRETTTIGHPGPGSQKGQGSAVEMARSYLDSLAERLRAEGVRVQAHPLTMGDAAVAIDEGAEMVHADAIALATHGRDPAGRLQYGSIAWRALLRSTVPVLIRHVDPDEAARPCPEPARRRIMVPLDGSALAEMALPLAVELAVEWQAALQLVRVVGDRSATDGAAPDGGDDVGAARDYLRRVADPLGPEVEARVLMGEVVETLVEVVGRSSITDIVMTTHDRTGLTRAIVGSIPDAMIHQLHCPIVVIPVLATA